MVFLNELVRSSERPDPQMARKSIKKNDPDKECRMSDPLDTPMMRQYLDLKEQYPDTILFFRMGDFYEMFLEDAERAAPLMDVALTRRQNKIPMAGVPYHSVDTYVARLIGAGEKVAIAEQEADPENAKLMRRKVRRIITPGTLVEEPLLVSHAHNYLLALAPGELTVGLALADVSTGDFFSLEIESDGDDGEDLAGKIRDCYFRYQPREILLPAEQLATVREMLPEAAGALTPLEDWKCSTLEGKRRLAARYEMNPVGLGYESESSPALAAVSLVLHYVAATFPGHQIELTPPVYRPTANRIMVLDEQTIRNLDLVTNYQEGGHSRTLYGILNFCRTAAGKRRLREAVLTPLLNDGEIRERAERVDFFFRRPDEARAVLEDLSKVHDLERTVGRVASGRGAPRDFIALRDTILAAQSLNERFATFEGPGEIFHDFIKIADPLRELAIAIGDVFFAELPAVVGGGPLVRPGNDENLDRAREALESGSQWILDFEKEEKERTGISTLRIRYNKVVGYFIEISRGQAERAPAGYERKQTLVGNERFTCDRLRELESSILQADETVAGVEQRFFREYQELLLSLRTEIRVMMSAIAGLDFLLALAVAATKYGWNRPIIGSDGELVIEEGRHPVVEPYLVTGEHFTPNDVQMDSRERSFAVLTGPNMAGKSTYIRQVALIQLLMQIGSFVPARHAVLSIVDRIFTRIGAADNLTRGESTFFVEMLETARILNQSTENSLVIMDEVGRGTSTYDGLSIAWAVVEYFSGPGKKPRVLFATHYHELTALESRPGVFNLTMDVREAEERIVFLHRVREGAADRSYGIHVACLAGLPPEVTRRAEEKLKELETDFQRQKEEAVRAKSVPWRAKKSRGRSVEGQAEQGTLF